jgi:hypothetical protein
MPTSTSAKSVPVSQDTVTALETRIVGLETALAKVTQLLEAAQTSQKSAKAESESDRVFRITGVQKSAFRGRVLGFMLAGGPGVYTAKQVHDALPGIDYANIAASFKHVAYILERNPCGYSFGFSGRNENAEGRLSVDAPLAIEAPKTA